MTSRGARGPTDAATFVELAPRAGRCACPRRRSAGLQVLAPQCDGERVVEEDTIALTASPSARHDVGIGHTSTAWPSSSPAGRRGSREPEQPPRPQGTSCVSPPHGAQTPRGALCAPPSERLRALEKRPDGRGIREALGVGASTSRGTALASGRYHEHRISNHRRTNCRLHRDRLFRLLGGRPEHATDRNLPGRGPAVHAGFRLLLAAVCPSNLHAASAVSPRSRKRRSVAVHPRPD